MHIPLPFHETTTTSAVSTGELPVPEVVQLLLAEVHDLYRSLDEGAVADYIPALANADPSLFGVSIFGVGGRSFSVGDSDHRFSIQSISKAFVFALVCDAIGHEEAHRLLGVNATGLAFNSVMAIELNDERTMNPMVNAGAMATTSLVPGATKRGTVGVHPGGTVAVRRAAARARLRGVRVGVRHQPAEPGHRPSPGELRPALLPIPTRPPTSTPGSARSW